MTEALAYRLEDGQVVCASCHVPANDELVERELDADDAADAAPLTCNHCGEAV